VAKKQKHSSSRKRRRATSRRFSTLEAFTAFTVDAEDAGSVRVTARVPREMGESVTDVLSKVFAHVFAEPVEAAAVRGDREERSDLVERLLLSLRPMQLETVIRTGQLHLDDAQRDALVDVFRRAPVSARCSRGAPGAPGS
jgi:hypothetical protein